MSKGREDQSERAGRLACLQSPSAENQQVGWFWKAGSGAWLPSPESALCPQLQDSRTAESISSVQLLSCVQLSETPRTAACQASMSITNSWSLLKLMAIEL